MPIWIMIKGFFNKALTKKVLKIIPYLVLIGAVAYILKIYHYDVIDDLSKANTDYQKKITKLDANVTTLSTKVIILEKVIKNKEEENAQCEELIKLEQDKESINNVEAYIEYPDANGTLVKFK